MVYLFLGPDDYTKKQRIAKMAADFGGQTIAFSAEGDKELPPAEILRAYISGDLFGGKKLILVQGALAQANFADEFFSKLDSGGAASGNAIIFIESALDKRKNETKQLLARKDLKTEEFEIPRGEDFRKWVLARAKELNIVFAPNALSVFLARLGENYDLWLADSELKKLAAFADGEKEISAEDVSALVSENLEEDVFAVTNAIGDKNKEQAVRLLQNYFDRIDGDEKGKIISLSALLADQFRNMLIMQELAGRNMPEAQIAKEMEFTPGRVFIYKKLAQRFSADKLLDALRKFEILDEEVKTSNGPASLQFFMIIDGLMR